LNLFSAQFRFLILIDLANPMLYNSEIGSILTYLELSNTQVFEHVLLAVLACNEQYASQLN
uniref:Dymeclin n=1 Tax=Anisakis simplex TaxID=6269 RepID=A0A0M3K8P1_ANISI